MKLITRSLSLVALLGIASAANATQMFNLNYSIPDGLSAAGNVDVSAVLTTNDLLSGSYLVTGITGTRTVLGNTASITGLLPVNSFGGNDNLLFPTSPFVDFDGISFTLSDNSSGSNTNRVNFYFASSSVGYTENGATGFGFNVSVTPANTPVPEPGSIALLVGMASVSGIMLRRRNRK